MTWCKGIRECEIIQWFVEPDARVEEFDKICEVQSDKASVDIPSRFSGVIKKLHYEAGEMAIVGKPLVDIDVVEDVEEEDPVVAKPAEVKDSETASNTPDGFMNPPREEKRAESEIPRSASRKGTHASLATPAIRHLSKELDVDINDVDGTGRDGRVTKEDLYNFQEFRQSRSSPSDIPSSQSSISSGPQQETVVPLTPTQSQMFKTMTRSLSIPHFCFSDELDLSSLSTLRHRFNSSISPTQPKLSYLPFIIKALSLALNQYPILNSRVQLSADDNNKPSLVHRTQHNVGVAMDTPSGLLVPVIKDITNLSIASIASEITRLQTLARDGKLTSADLSGGTITVSNIGSIGGTYLSPVIVDSQVAILAVGKMRVVPGFGVDGELVRKDVMNFSWSADHRVVDGATVARASEVVRGLVERPESMVVQLR